MPYYVNLPISYAVRERWYLDYFVDNGISPELGMDTYSVQTLSDREHEDVARRLEDAGIGCGVHLPFFDLHPGSLNDAVLQASRETLLRAVERAQRYGPGHFIGHPAYDASQHAPDDGRFDDWLFRSAQTWSMVLEATDAMLHLENTHEKEPLPLEKLLDTLRTGSGSHRVGICFDVGHWYSFGGGYSGRAGTDLASWLRSFAPYLTHLHLHDNDGSTDQHVGLGQGEIPFETLFTELERHGLHPTATLEPHDEESFYASMAWFAAHNSYVAQLNV